jgi:hypothetical protein
MPSRTWLHSRVVVGKERDISPNGSPPRVPFAPSLLPLLSPCDDLLRRTADPGPWPTAVRGWWRCDARQESLRMASAGRGCAEVCSRIQELVSQCFGFVGGHENSDAARVIKSK